MKKLFFILSVALGLMPGAHAAEGRVRLQIQGTNTLLQIEGDGHVAVPTMIATGGCRRPVT